MTETLRKKIVTALIWVLIITPVHIAIGAVSAVSVLDSKDQSGQSVELHKELSAAHQFAEDHHNDLDHDSTDNHCKQDVNCNGCDTCNHCLNVICSKVQFDVPASHLPYIFPSIPLYQTDVSNTFRPPRRS